ncbi:hypothetical protein [Citromicrobium sp. WPS32]|uniref:hypothetical protein n=1 Tax=Citromicrobium sp. WPS32 TaxID=1634517 RepID=UPI000AEC1DD5|nr:hypothetical protein [Citromicrobium sp. WPS32]
MVSKETNTATADESQDAAHVLHYVPDASGEELEHRIALLKARDWGAAMRGRTESLRAFNLAIEAHEVAGAFVFAINETPARLGQAAKLARHLIGAAMHAELLDLDGGEHG